ncbi:MAG: hypothetical protein M1836_003608 [Candelina mexicana]|nr:MAG: hypothetical protein M1836_003608 [Candelina mexicana]
MNSEKIVSTKAVNQIVNKVQREAQRLPHTDQQRQEIQNAINKSLAEDSLLAEVADEFKQLYQEYKNTQEDDYTLDKI